MFWTKVHPETIKLYSGNRQSGPNQSLAKCAMNQVNKRKNKTHIVVFKSFLHNLLFT